MRRQPDPVQRGEQPVPAAVAGEDAPRTVAAVRGRGQADDAARAARRRPSRRSGRPQYGSSAKDLRRSIATCSRHSTSRGHARHTRLTGRQFAQVGRGPRRARRPRAGSRRHRGVRRTPGPPATRCPAATNGCRSLTGTFASAEAGAIAIDVADVKELIGLVLVAVSARPPGRRRAPYQTPADPIASTTTQTRASIAASIVESGGPGKPPDRGVDCPMPSGRDRGRDAVEDVVLGGDQVDVAEAGERSGPRPARRRRSRRPGRGA